MVARLLVMDLTRSPEIFASERGESFVSIASDAEVVKYKGLLIIGLRSGVLYTGAF
jgi:hypothetical protein